MPRCSGSVVLLLSVLVFTTSSSLFSQDQQPVSDPQAVSFVSQSLAAMTGGTNVSDVTLNGSAVWNVASLSETANATLMAKGTGQSRFDMTLNAGPRSEIRNDGSSSTQGELLVPDGSVLSATGAVVTDFATRPCIEGHV